MPRRKGAKKAAPAVESPIVDEIADAYAEEDADVEGFGSGDPNAVAEAAAAAAVAAEAAAAAAAGNDPDEAILEAAARSAVAEAASDGAFLFVFRLRDAKVLSQSWELFVARYVLVFFKSARHVPVFRIRGIPSKIPNQ